MEKRILLTVLITGLFVATSFGQTTKTREQGPAKKNHLKIIKIENGKRTELDTMVEGNGTFIWKGDTLVNKMNLMKNGFNFNTDSLGRVKIFSYDVSDSGKKSTNKIYVFTNKEGNSESGEFAGKGNAMWMSSNGRKMLIETPGDVSDLMAAPDIRVVTTGQGGNSIDLSDPGIISFKKKKLSGGREKITIVRKTPSDKNKEGQSQVTKAIRIIKSGDGESGDLQRLNKTDSKNIKVIVTGKDENEKKGK